MPSVFSKARVAIISLTLFLFPLFFLPITTEFYATNKQYLLVAASFILMALSAFELVYTKKIDRHVRMFDIPIALLLGAVVLSILIVSPNKHAAAIAPVTGILSIAACAVIYFFLSRESDENNLSSYVTILQYSVLIVCTIQIALYISVQLGVVFPPSVTFMSSAQFTPLGSIVDLIAFLGFFFVYSGIRLFLAWGSGERSIEDSLSFLLVTASLGLASYTYFTTSRTDIPYAPLEYTLRTIPQLVQSPLTTLFGVGVDNFSASFTQAKDSAYAQAPYGVVQSFSYGRSALVHYFTETGLIGLGALLLIVFKGMYESLSLPSEVKIATFGLFAYMLVAFIVFPPSLVLVFLLFITVGLVHHDIKTHSHRPTHKRQATYSRIPTIAAGSGIVIVLCFVGWSMFHLGRIYLADVLFRRSVQSIATQNLSATYTSQLSAIRLNPYSEKYRMSFSQTNLYIANRIAEQAQQTNSKLSPSDQSTVRNAISTSIQEARAATILNEEKAAHWENLGKIYKNLLNVAEGAEGFAISSFQRALRLDPYNPVYKNELGETYFLTKKYQQAITHFKEALVLKPDYTNARYNLAWSLYSIGQKKEARAEFEKVADAYSQNPQSLEFKKVQSDLERLKL